jgi:hypothetical protein
MSILLPLVVGMGRDRYMKVLYVVDVYRAQAHLRQPAKYFREDTTSRTTRLVTRHAFQPVPKLPLEKVNDDAIVPHAVYLPLLLARDLLRQLFELLFSIGRHLVHRFVEDTIQILV